MTSIRLFSVALTLALFGGLSIEIAIPIGRSLKLWSSMKGCFSCVAQDYERLLADAYVLIDNLLRQRVHTDDFEANLQEIDKLLVEAASPKNYWIRTTTKVRLFGAVAANVAMDALFRLMKLRQLVDSDVAKADKYTVIKTNRRIVFDARNYRNSTGTQTPRIDNLIREALNRLQKN